MNHKIPLVGLSLTAVMLASVLFINKINKKGILVDKEIASSKPQNLLAQISKLSAGEKAPSLVGISDWINSGVLNDADLRGKVTLVDFWTYSCINCIRTIPHLNSWHEKYKDNGFIILGVHSPEFDFEKKKENVETAVKKYGITYPVALDSSHETWNAFGNQYWPAHYLIDAKGNIRYRSFGEGHYAETESSIQSLLFEAGLLTLDKITEAQEPPPDTNFQNIGTPEIYLGYRRINNAGNIDSGTKPDLPHVFFEPKLSDLLPNRFYFSGTWTINSEFSELSEKNGALILRYKAGKVNIVAEAKDGKEIPVEILFDGKTNGTISVSSPQLYNLIDAVGDGDWHTLEIRALRPGLRVFTFTFG